MIEKLVIQKLTVAGKEYEYPDTTALVGKINELVDAVNLLQCKNVHIESDLQDLMYPKEIKGELQMKLEPEKCEIPADNSEKANCQENVQDKFAEQRKWIGKLCRFWDDDAFVTSNDWAFGILTSIDKGMQFQYCCNENCNFKHCEPVKPTDCAIYKGGDNE